jgi:hypothetical protein
VQAVGCLLTRHNVVAESSQVIEIDFYEREKYNFSVDFLFFPFLTHHSSITFTSCFLLPRQTYFLFVSSLTFI